MGEGTWLATLNPIVYYTAGDFELVHGLRREGTRRATVTSAEGTEFLNSAQYGTELSLIGIKAIGSSTRYVRHLILLTNPREIT